MSECYYYKYFLFTDNCCEKNTGDINYAMYWLLTNLLDNRNSWFEIRAYVSNDPEYYNNYILEAIIKYDGINIIRVHPKNFTVPTIYSPYDLTLFVRSDLSFMYMNLLETKKAINPITVVKITKEVNNNTNNNANNNASNNNASNNNASNNNASNNNASNNNANNNASNQISIKQEISNIKQLSNELNNKYNNQDINSDKSSDICSEDIHNIEKELDEMLKLKQELETKTGIKEKELTDIVCEDNYKKKIEFRNKERGKERRNIFIADLNVYKNLHIECGKVNNKNHEQQLELITVEQLVPGMFAAKFYIIKFMDINGYLLDEDINSPSNELYELYNMFFNVKFNPNNEEDVISKYSNEFYELLLEFLEYIEDKNVVSYEQIREQLNKNSDVVAML